MKRQLRIFGVCFFCFVFFLNCLNAKEHSLSDILNIAKESEKMTKDKVTKILGKPTIEVEENKRKSKWLYNSNKYNLIIHWKNSSETIDRIIFNTGDNIDRKDFDFNISTKIKSGVTELQQAIKLLGTPQDMLLKKQTQEVHYCYTNNTLRLFFRNHVLVDFALY